MENIAVGPVNKNVEKSASIVNGKDRNIEYILTRPIKSVEKNFRLMIHISNKPFQIGTPIILKTTYRCRQDHLTVVPNGQIFSLQTRKGPQTI
mgnify:CR=1 FL=1